ncbi:MMPL family transporter [Bacillus carboniphilus]|uniref:MMPL family transporter n=1 Tax=Bacillus carboniphilus TaxID=86663 RepID=A0ABN0WMH3_9BACI
MENSYVKWVVGKKSKWITILVWIALATVLNFVFPQANQQVNDSAGNFDELKASTEASNLIEEEFPNESGVPALIVWNKELGLGDEEIQQIRSVVQDLSENPLPDQKMIPPLHTIPEEVLMGQVSENGKTFIMPVFFNDGVDATRLKENVSEMSERAESLIGANPFNEEIDSASLSARVTGPVGILMDATDLFSSGDFSLTIITFILVLTVLLIIYRSPILALIPLIGVGFAYSIISPVLGALGENGVITFDSQGISIMTVLLFGAGTDYCLFLISRFRSYLKVNRESSTALKEATKDKSGAIAMSALTTISALSFLLLADFGPIERFSIPFVLAIFVVALSSLTLVPAILAVLGRVSFFPFIPMPQEMMEQKAMEKGKSLPKQQDKVKLSEKINSFVVDRAKTVTIATTIVLVGLAAFTFQIKYTYDTLSSFPEDMASSEGFQLIENSFNAGQLAPITLAIDTEGKEVNLQENLSAQDFVGDVTEPVPGQNNANIHMYSIELTMNPYSNEAMDVIPELREIVSTALANSGISDTEKKVWIAGQTAEQYDIRETSSRDASILVPLIIIIIALLVLGYLRSITAMIYLMATVVVSYFSALGLGWIIIHYVMGADAIQGFIPLYAFIFLGALGVDYNILMKSSIWKKARYMPLKKAIKEGANETGGVINSAGVILAGTFAVLATLPIQILVHFGIITAVGVLIDTFIVRPFLVPAITAWFGKKAFWPGKYEEIKESESDSSKQIKGEM